MKKIIYFFGLVITTLTIKSQTLTDLIFLNQPDYPIVDTKMNLIVNYQYDFGGYSQASYGYIDTSSIQFRSLSYYINSVNTNTRLVGINSNGELTPFDISALNIPQSVNQYTASRPINGSTYTIGSKGAWVNYSIRIQCNNTLLLTSAGGTVALQYSTNGGSTWVDVSQVENELNIALLGSNSQCGVLSGFIPASAIVRMNTTIATGAGIGSTTATFVRGQENY